MRWSIVAMLSASLVIPSTWAADRRRPQQYPNKPPAQVERPKSLEMMSSAPGQPAAPSPVEQLRKLPPAERQRVLESLPPARRKRLEQRLHDYESLPKAHREQLDQAYDKFKNLPQQKQEAVRQSFSTFTQLPPDRKQALRQEMRTLRSLPEEKRAKRMSSREFQDKYNPDERRIMQEMTSLSNP